MSDSRQEAAAVEQSPQQRQRARIAGWLMASTFLTSIPAALILYDPVLNDTGYTLVAIHDWTFLLGPGFCVGVNGILLGWMMYRTGLMPPRLALLGVVLFAPTSRTDCTPSSHCPRASSRRRLRST
jgi:Domain of unknown function (DUF4386)